MARARSETITLAVGFGAGIVGASVLACWCVDPWWQLGWCWVLLITLSFGTIALLNGG